MSPHSTHLALLRRLLDHPARGHFLGPTLLEVFDRYARGGLARRAAGCCQQGCVECGDVTPFLFRNGSNAVISIVEWVEK